MEEKKPVFHEIGPVWWHKHGIKMKLKECDKDIGHIVIQGSAAKITIDKGSIDRTIGWFVEWEVVQLFPTKEQTNGRVFMSHSELANAFGLKDDIDRGSEWLIDRYGGSAAEQGKFIRYEKYLNIPCPGTGHDGDPNISIEIDDDIKEAVRVVLRC